MSDKKNVLALIDDDPKILDLSAKYLRDQEFNVHIGIPLSKTIDS